MRRKMLDSKLCVKHLCDINIRTAVFQDIQVNVLGVHQSTTKIIGLILRGKIRKKNKLSKKLFQTHVIRGAVFEIFLAINPLFPFAVIADDPNTFLVTSELFNITSQFDFFGVPP